MAKVRVKIPTVNEKLLNKYIRHSVYLEQLKNGEAKLISRFLKQKTFPKIYEKLIAELGRVKDLESVGSIYKLKRLKRMLAATHKISTAGMVKAEKMLIGRLVNISKFEAQWNKNIIEKTIPLDLDMTMPSNEVLRNLVTMRPFDGHKLGTWMKSYSTAIRVAMVKQIKVGVSTGESLPAIGRRINKALNWKGKQAEYIARTAVSNVVHQAKEEVFKKNRDIIRKVQLHATLDDRTTIQCIHLDGQVFDIGVGPRPPIHFSCRTTSVPLTPSWQEFGVVDPPAATRASMNGAVPAKMNYRQWLKQQGKTAKGRAVQDKVLGKKRAELYRSGKVRIDRFVGKDLKPLTLKQLAKREGLDLAPAPPMQVNAMPIKGVGKLTKTDNLTIKSFTQDNFTNVNRALLNRPLSKGYPITNKAMALKEAVKVEKAINKLDGWKGTSYRGMSFKTEIERTTFLKQFKEGSVWKNKSFQSTAKNKFAIKRFVGRRNRVSFEIKGNSGRDLTRYAEYASEKEVLFAKGTPFKVDKIVGNKVYLTEITKQAQLKVPTTTKVGTTFAKTTSKEFQDTVTKQIDSYPEKVKAGLNKQGITFNAGNKLTEMYPELKGRHPRGWPAGTTWDSSDGIYYKTTKSISASETYRPIRKKEFIKTSKSETKGLLNHETGHGFDWSFSGRYSNTDKFKLAYKKDFAAMTKNEMGDRQLQYFHQAGEAGRQETFAEVFADIMGQGARSKAYKYVDISEFFPNCKKYIEDVLK